MKVLVVSRDGEFAADLADGLRSQGFDVQIGEDSAIALARCCEVDALFLDRLLADTDGFEACRAIRAISHVPVIMMAAHGDEFDCVLSFKLGADDYVVRSCSLRELTVRAQAVIRRARNLWVPHNHSAPQGLVRKIGHIRIDLRRRCVFVHGRHVPLTRKEFDILALLIADPDRVFTREYIMAEVWGHDGAGDTRTLGVHMSGLRKKLGPPTPIETVRGIGFRLAVTP